MKKIFFYLFIVTSMILKAQKPLYDFLAYKKTIEVPASLSNERTAVIFSVPDKSLDGYTQVGDYREILGRVHKGFVTMGIDAVMYLQDINLIASQSAKQSYLELFNQRKIRNIIFFTQNANTFEIIIAPFGGVSEVIKDNSDVFFMRSESLNSLLLNVGKEIRRADQELQNFLIPEKPSYMGGLSIVEKTLLKNYPGILRRSKLAVERFALMDSLGVSDEKAAENIRRYNKKVREKNKELASILEKGYPYDYVMIDPMSDDELKRNRYQFVLRSACSTVETVKKMLDYEVVPGETGFASIIPVMPDQTKVKTIPRNALVCKFYIRQNISKNVHVGVWDADVTWQQALHNMIGNLTQELRVN